MAGIKHTVTIGNETFKRVSPRVYTHATIGRVNIDRMRANAADVAAFRAELARPGNWDYYVGGWRKYEATNSAAENLRHEAREADYRARGIDAVAAERSAEAAARVEMQIAAGTGRMVVLGWSMSLKNAQKMADKFRSYNEYYRDIQVVECIRHEKAAK